MTDRLNDLRDQYRTNRGLLAPATAYINGLEDELLQARREREEAIQALKHIMWIKDCGIDGRNEAGEFVNFSEQERDKMYEIARSALTTLGVNQP